MRFITLSGVDLESDRPLFISLNDLERRGGTISEGWLCLYVGFREGEVLWGGKFIYVWG